DCGVRRCNAALVFCVFRCSEISRHEIRRNKSGVKTPHSRLGSEGELVECGAVTSLLFSCVFRCSEIFRHEIRRNKSGVKTPHSRLGSEGEIVECGAVTPLLFFVFFGVQKLADTKSEETKAASKRRTPDLDPKVRLWSAAL